MADNNNFQVIWRDAFKSYKDKTKRDLLLDPKALETLKSLHSTDDLMQRIGERSGGFESFRKKHGKLASCIQMCMKPVEILGGMITSAIAMTPYAPACAIFGAGLFLISAADAQSGAYDFIESLFEQLGEFTVRVEYYTKGDMVPHLQKKVTAILTFLLEIFAITEKEVKAGRFKTFLATAFLKNDNEVKGALDRLNTLMETEEKLVIAITLATVQETKKTVDRTEKTLEKTEKTVQRTESTVERTEKTVERTEKTTERTEKAIMSFASDSKAAAKEAENHKLVKEALESPALAKIRAFHEGISDKTQSGTAEWVIQDHQFKQWMRNKTSVLLVIGGEGAGKSHLASKIVSHLEDQYRQDPQHPSRVSIGYFFVRADDPQLLSTQTILKSIAYQIAMNDQLYKTHVVSAYSSNKGLSSAKGIWETLFLKFFEPSRKQESSAFMVIDGLEKVPEAERIELLACFKHFENLHDAGPASRLRIALIGRSELREESTPYAWSRYIAVSAESNGPDIDLYIRNHVNRVQLIQPGRGRMPDAEKEALRQEIIEKLSAGADGMFTWVNLMIDQIAKKEYKKKILAILDKQPRGLHEAIRHVLEDFAADPNVVKEDLNEMLGWIGFSRRFMTLGELDVALTLSHEDHEAMSQLEERLRGKFSSFFTLDREDHLTTERLQERARNSLRLQRKPTENQEVEDTEDSPSIDRIIDEVDVISFDSKLATTIVRLKEGIREYLVEKGFPPAGKGPDNPGIGFEIPQMELHIAITCLTVLRNEDHTAEFPDSNLSNYAAEYVVEHLNALDWSKVGRDDKSTILSLLSSLFREEEAMNEWITSVKNWDTFFKSWFSTNKQSQSVRHWFAEADSLEGLDEDELAFMQAAAKSAKDLFKPLAMFCGEMWLTMKGYGRDLAPFVLFLHFYLAMDDDGNMPYEADDSLVLDFDNPGIQDISAERLRKLAEFADLEQNPFWHARLAKVIREAGHIADAIPEFRLAIDADPKMWQAKEGLAFCYEARSEYTQAIEIEREALAAIPEDDKESKSWALENISEWSLSSGRIDDAIDAAEKAYSLAPDDLWAMCCCIKAMDAGSHLDKLLDFTEALGKTFPAASEDSETVKSTPVVSHLTSLLLSSLPIDSHEILATAAKSSNRLDFVSDAIKTAIAAAKKGRDFTQVAVQRYKLATLYLDKADKPTEAIKVLEQLLEEATASGLDDDDDYPWSIRNPALTQLSLLYFNEAVAARDAGRPYEHLISKLEGLAKDTKESESDPDVYRMIDASSVLGLWYRWNDRASEAKQCLTAKVLSGIDILKDNDLENDFLGWLYLAQALFTFGDRTNAAAALAVTTAPLDKLKAVKAKAERVEADTNVPMAQEANVDAKPTEPLSTVPVSAESLSSATNTFTILEEPPSSITVPVATETRITETHTITVPAEPLPVTTTDGKQAPSNTVEEETALNPNDDSDVSNDTTFVWECDGDCKREKEDWTELHFCDNCYDVCFCDKCFELVKLDKAKFKNCTSKHTFYQAYPVDKKSMDLAVVVEDGVVTPRDKWLEKLKEAWV